MTRTGGRTRQGTGRDLNSYTPLKDPRPRQGLLVSKGSSGSDGLPFPNGMARDIIRLQAGPNRWAFVTNGSEAAAIKKGHRISLSTEWWQSNLEHAAGRLQFSLAADDAALIEARELLERAHPRRPPPNGVYLLCSFRNKEDQLAAYQTAADQPERQEPWSSAWYSADGRIVGCLVISRLFHGNPHGREYLAKAAGRRWRPKQKRNKVVENLKVCWVSRIAVDAPYRNAKIGTALAAEALIVAKHRLLWEPEYLEVIRSVSADEAKRMYNQPKPKDWLTDAGYVRTPAKSRVIPTRPLDSTGGRTSDIEGIRQVYYWGTCV